MIAVAMVLALGCLEPFSPSNRLKRTSSFSKVSRSSLPLMLYRGGAIEWTMVSRLR